MGRPRRQQGLIVEADFSRGMIRDTHRIAIPDGGFYDSFNMLCHKRGMAYKRGGTTYAGPELTGSTYAPRIAYAEFPAGAKLCAIGSNNHFYTVTAGTTTDVGATSAPFVGDGTPPDTMKLFSGGTKNLLIIPAADGILSPKTYNGVSTIADLGGSPPGAKYVSIHKSRIVLANGRVAGSDYPARVWFSPTPDPETTWDTTNSWIDVARPITGLASLQNALLIFSSGHLQRITGDTPPPGTNMVLEPVGDIGCPDARAIIVQDANCIFANPTGVFLTNGAGFQNLTREGSILTLGLYARTFLFVTYRNPAGNWPFLYSLMCHLPTKAWWRVTGVTPFNYSPSTSLGSELYFGGASEARIVRLSTILTPMDTNSRDANGTIVGGYLETRPLGHGPGVKHFERGHLSYDLRSSTEEKIDPQLTVGTGPGVNATTYTDQINLPKTTDADRQPFTVAALNQFVSIRLSVPQASSKAEIYAIEVEERSLFTGEGGIS
jgi:hypothetical protein